MCTLGTSNILSFFSVRFPFFSRFKDDGLLWITLLEPRLKIK